MKSVKRILLFLAALCLVLPLTLSAPLPVSAAEWEETYYGSPLEYYAGEAKSISTSDASFDDWSGISKVTISSAEHPENWSEKAFEEITYNYAIAWDNNNLYVYYDIDKPFESFSVENCSPRFYLNTNEIANYFTYFVQFNYKPDNGIYISRAKRGDNTYDMEFAAAIGVYGAEIDGKTYVEMSIPWSELNISNFTPGAGASLRYTLYVQTDKSGAGLYAHDFSIFGNFKPSVNASRFLTMYFSDGTAARPVITPSELEKSEVLRTDYKELNVALGKSYTGTIATGWTNNNGKLLTEGSFQDINTIADGYMEGFRATDFSNGTVVRTIDLSSMVSGLYKFEIGTAQIINDHILFPSEVRVYASANGFHYQLLGIAAATEHTTSPDGSREVQKYTLVLDQGVMARYIRIKVFAPESSFDIVPLSEITTIYNEDASLFPEEGAVVSLGAKVNLQQNGLRFGAKYNRVTSKEVKQLGMLLYPTAKLGSDKLDMDYYKANPYSTANPSGVILMNAVNISASDYRPGKDFKDYETFIFFITLLNIPEASLSVNITAVPFIEYADEEVVYGEALVRNFNDVKAAADSIPE